MRGGIGHVTWPGRPMTRVQHRFTVYGERSRAKDAVRIMVGRANLPPGKTAGSLHGVLEVAERQSSYVTPREYTNTAEEQSAGPEKRG